MSDVEELFKSLMGEDEKKEKSISLSEVIKLAKVYWCWLWSKRWIIIFLGLLGGILGYIYAYNRKVTYEARYSFTVGGGSSAIGGLGNISAMLGISGGNTDAFSGDNVLEIIRSRSMVEKTLLRPVEYQTDTITFAEYLLICDSVRASCEAGDVKEPSDGGVSICDIHYPYGQDRQTFSRVQDSLLMALSSRLIKNNISASRRDKKLSFMDYSFSFTDEMFAKQFSVAHLDEVTKFYVQTKTGLSRKNVTMFEAKADSVKEELNRALSRRAAFADANRNGSGMYVSSQLQKIEVEIQVLASTYQEVMKNVQVMKLDLARETPLIQLVDEPHMPLPNDKLRKLKAAIIGSFIAGFLTVLFLIAFYYAKSFRQKLKVEMEDEAGKAPQLEMKGESMLDK